ncbi:MAG: prepilin-type N-terminal cleavage/methylation domain-containing protein [Bacteriovorax sp.]|nr:prepilin-type N-terminal cleavage/methylation domain-containing protein [Bacteriovorax sp.]
MSKLALKNEQGFTLVELMVVVAIIGILSAIAVPNFKKYQAKAKQSEAKIQLAAIYSTEVGTSADYDTYGTCLTTMGYEASPRGYYLVGFATGVATPLITGACTAADSPIVPPATQLAAVTANMPVLAANLIATTTSTQTAFLAGASASISSAVALDQWTINQAKLLSNDTAGF